MGLTGTQLAIFPTLSHGRGRTTAQDIGAKPTLLEAQLLRGLRIPLAVPRLGLGDKPGRQLLHSRPAAC